MSVGEDPLEGVEVGEEGRCGAVKLGVEEEDHVVEVEDQDVGDKVENQVAGAEGVVDAKCERREETIDGRICAHVGA